MEKNKIVKIGRLETPKVKNQEWYFQSSDHMSLDGVARYVLTTIPMADRRYDEDSIE